MGETRYDVFRYLAATEHADAYRAIMREFAAAKQRFIVHLRPEELAGTIGRGNSPRRSMRPSLGG